MKRSDHWVWLRNTFAATALVALIGFAAAPRVVRAAACTGDCGNVSKVTVTDILTMVDIALGTEQLSACTNGDPSGDGHVTVDEILQAVNNALNGCAPAVVPGCGNGVVETDLGEECDHGGTCLGGDNAGDDCTSESDCQGNGVCTGGSKAETSCDPNDASACPDSSCQKCITHGGDGCAANCTLETTVQMPLVPGVASGGTIEPGTSGSTLSGSNPSIGQLGLTMTGSQQLAVGKQVNNPSPHAVKNNQVPVVINAVHIDPVDVSGLSCVCVRGVPDKTCGGMLFEPDGTIATDCTPGYTEGTCSTSKKSCHVDSDCTPSGQTCDVHVCEGKKHCAFVHGLGGTCSLDTTITCGPKSPCPSGKGTCVPGGNMSSGVISCVAGLKGTNMLMTEDSAVYDNGTIVNDPPKCDPGSPQFQTNIGTDFPTCGQAPVITLSDETPEAPAGSAVVLNSTALGQFVNQCGPSNPEQPPHFCTDQEAYTTKRGVPSTLPAVTGIASAQLYNAFVAGTTTDESVCNCSDGSTLCAVSDCTVTSCDLCPVGQPSVQGSPLPVAPHNVCSSPFSPSVSGLGLAGAFTSLANSSTYDIVVSDLLQAK